MRTKAEKNKENFKDINKMIRDSEMWVLINLDRNGVHFQSSNQEEGLALIALIIGSKEETWGIIQEYVKKIKLAKQKTMN
jgi:hypothetical protein